MIFATSSALHSAGAVAELSGVWRQLFQHRQGARRGREFVVRSEGDALARVFTGNYSYDDSKVLAAPNAFDPALAPGNRLFKRPLHSANLVANAHFLRMNWNIAGFYVGRRTDSDFLGLGHHEQSELRALGSCQQHRSGPRVFHRGSFRESFRPPLPGSRSDIRRWDTTIGWA